MSAVFADVADYAGLDAALVLDRCRSVAELSLIQVADWRIVGLTGGGWLLPRRMHQEGTIG
ncbi:MAG: hypothetical protein U9O18_03525 [Chloroflexota bacterium]|nr:hypothetical protein [Chloroflexota bacterium]